MHCYGATIRVSDEEGAAMQRGPKFAFAIAGSAIMFWLLPLNAVPAQQRTPGATDRPAPTSEPPAPAPYRAVAVTLPKPYDDQSFEAFRRQLSDIAERKDRAALGRMVVQKGFFWERESGDGSDAKKSGRANFAAAIGIDSPDDPDTGWDTIAIYAEDATVFALSDRPGVICGPADPAFDDDAFQALVDTTRTDVGDWVYPLTSDVEVRATPRPDAAVVEKLGLIFLRVVAFDGAPDAETQAAGDFVRVMLPSGKFGFIMTADIASLGVSQICYRKENDAWKITGVLGGGE
jgi:hypothetical protein